MPVFESFILLAEMRTGSNLVEAALNQLDGVTCHGEAFNPVLIGYPKLKELLGITKEERDAEPKRLWKAIRKAKGLNGCRFFHNHDPRVLDMMLDDPTCAKIILTRNPIESYVSLKIARATGQWKLGDAKNRKSADAKFDASEFEEHLTKLQAFQMRLMNHLQRSGQTAFYIDYEDAQDLQVLNGLATWLGTDARLSSLPSSLVVQNPDPLESKVVNFHEMEASLARLDRFNLSRTPNFEPRRGPAVPGFVACKDAGLIYMPIRPEPGAPIRKWMESIGPLEEGFSQKTLRQWKRQHPGHRSFTIVQHPLMRAHLALNAVLHRTEMADVRAALRRPYKLPLPAEGKNVNPETYAELLVAFLGWLKMNINGQTSLPEHPMWATQSSRIQGFAQFASPDLIIREDRLPEDLAYLSSVVGVKPSLFPEFNGDTGEIKLADIWIPELEIAARETFPRDFMQFGFGDWRTA